MFCTRFSSFSHWIGFFHIFFSFHKCSHKICILFSLSHGHWFKCLFSIEFCIYKIHFEWFVKSQFIFSNLCLFYVLWFVLDSHIYFHFILMWCTTFNAPAPNISIFYHLFVCVWFEPIDGCWYSIASPVQIYGIEQTNIIIFRFSTLPRVSFIDDDFTGAPFRFEPTYTFITAHFVLEMIKQMDFHTIAVAMHRRCNLNKVNKVYVCVFIQAR